MLVYDNFFLPVSDLEKAKDLHQKMLGDRRLKK